MIKIYLIILVFLVLPILTNSTCIVLVRLKDRFFIGADSRSIVKAYNKQKGEDYIKTQRDDVCKVFRKGTYFFGISTNMDAFTMQTYANIACESAGLVGGMNDVVELFSQNVTAYLQVVLEPIRLKNPSFYNDNYVKYNLAQIVFFTFTNGKPESLSISFGVSSKANEKVKVAQRIKRDSILVIGSDSEYKKMKDPFKKGTILGLMDIISAESQVHSEVGGPTNIIEITTNQIINHTLGSRCLLDAN